METHVLIFSEYGLLAAVLLTEHFPWGKSNQMMNYKKILQCRFYLKKENDVLIKKLFSLQNFKIFCSLVDFYNSMKYAKFQHRSPDKITKYTALYLEKWNFCWRQQFARVTQKPRVDVSKSHASCKNKL